MRSIILTFISSTSTGLLKRLGNLLQDHEAAYESSRINTLIDDIGGLIRFSISEKKWPILEEALLQLSDGEDGVLIWRDACADSVEEEEPDEMMFFLSGDNQPGIASALNTLLYRLPLKIFSFYTDVYDYGLDCVNHFEAQSLIEFAFADREAIIDALEDFAQEWQLEFSLGSDYDENADYDDYNDDEDFDEENGHSRQ